MATAGCALGLLVAYACIAILKRALPADIPHLSTVSLDWRVAMCAVAIAVRLERSVPARIVVWDRALGFARLCIGVLVLLVTALFAALAPAIRAARIDPISALRHE
jgi:ABC-type lipoprotein release transport system permease subunit